MKRTQIEVDSQPPTFQELQEARLRYNQLEHLLEEYRQSRLNGEFSWQLIENTQQEKVKARRYLALVRQRLILTYHFEDNFEQ